MKFSLRLLELEADLAQLGDLSNADCAEWTWQWLLSCCDVSRLVLAEEVTQ